MPFEIGVIPSVRVSDFCPSTFPFPDSNSKMLCPIEFKLDRVAFEIGVFPSVCLSVYSIDTIM